MTRDLYVDEGMGEIGGRRGLSRHLNEQFSRENDLDIDMNEITNAIVIGLGGIGSHVAEILGSFSSIEKIVLFDNDKVELSNLNRTAFDCTHLDVYKVAAMAESIARRNLNCNVVPVCDLFNESTYNEIMSDETDLKSRLRGRYGRNVHIFDCRDDDFQDHEIMRKLAGNLGYRKCKLWRAAYNGSSITIDGHSKDHPCWGQPGYTVIPSHSLPSRLVALMIVNYACTWNWYSGDMYKAGQALTFDSTHLIKHVHRSVLLQKMEENNPEAFEFMERFFNMYTDNPEFMKGKSFKYKKLPKPKPRITLGKGDEMDPLADVVGNENETIVQPEMAERINLGDNV